MLAAAILAIVAAQGPAPEATPHPASAPSFVIDDFTTRIVAEETGATRVVEQMTVRLRDAAAVQRWGSMLVPFLNGRDTVTLTALEIRKADGRVLHPENVSLEDSTLSGSFDAPIYSDLRIKHITIPSLEAGDRLHTELTTVRARPLVDGRVLLSHSFIRDAVVQHEALEIDTPSAVRLTVKVRDDHGISAEPPARTGGRIERRWTHAQPTPDDSDDGAPRDAALWRGVALPAPDVQVSSFGTWPEVGAWYAALVAPQAAADDAVRQKAAELTAGLTTSRAKLEALHRFVAEHIRYVALAFGAGVYQPRPASLVLSTQYGDCKDKTTLLIALAASIGVRVNPALIATQHDVDPDVPSPLQFDHLIAVADVPGDGGPLWMDGTVEFAPAGWLVNTLRGKHAVVARADSGPPIVMTVTELPVVSSNETSIAAAIDPKGAWHLRVRYTMRGDLEIYIRGILSSLNDDTRMKAAAADLERLGLGAGKVTRVRTSDLHDFSTPIWYEFEADYSMSADQFTKSWDLWPPALRIDVPAVDDSAARAFDVRPRPPQIMKVSVELPFDAAVQSPVPLSLDRPFGKFTSVYAVSGRALSVERRLEWRAARLEPGQFDQVRAFSKAIESDYGQKFIVAPAAAGAVHLETADDLVHAATAAYGRRDFDAAIDLLQRAVAKDPRHPAAWNDLGRALNAQRRYAEAVKALETQVALKPYHEYAYSNLGLAYEGLGRDEDAEAAYRKQIDIVPLDRWAHQQLGLLLFRQKHYDEAVRSLQTAATITPDNPFLLQDLARAQWTVGRHDEALATFERALGQSNSPVLRNNIAYFLARQGSELDRAERFAREAVAVMAAELERAAIDRLGDNELGAMRSLGSFADTLGWVLLRRGDLDAAEQWVRAAWDLGQDAVVGLHLAEIEERRGRAANAAAARRLAAAGVGAEWVGRSEDGATVPTLDSLERGKATSELLAARTIRVTKSARDLAGSADLFVAAGKDGVISAVRFVSGEQSVTGMAQQIVGKSIASDLPDGWPAVVFRRAVLECPRTSDACSLVLVLPNDVRGVN